MRWIALVAVGLVCGFWANRAFAQDQVVLKGRITCAKCDLGESKRCATVVVVPGNGQQAVYYFDTESHKKYHADTCGGKSRNGTVTGKVGVAKDGKKFVVVSQVRFDP